MKCQKQEGLFTLLKIDMNDIRVTAKIYNLDSPSRTGRLYTEEALNGAFNNRIFMEQNENNGIPILTEDGELIGTAHCSLDYPTINIEGVINNSFKDVLNDACLTHSGCGYVEYDADKGIQIVTDYKLCELLLSSAAYVDCSMEVVKE